MARLVSSRWRIARSWVNKRLGAKEPTNAKEMKSGWVFEQEARDPCSTSKELMEGAEEKDESRKGERLFFLA